MIRQFKDLQCHVCLSNHVSLFDSFSNLGRATSDCKPWPKGGMLCICMDCALVQKVMDDRWHVEADEIYSHYELYHQAANGTEQLVFNIVTGRSTFRSVAVLEYIAQTVKIKANANVIDIGCGVGNMLKSLSHMFESASLYGFEPNAHKKEALENIKNVVNIYTNIDQLSSSKFDLLTMNHVLEHIESPLNVLKRLKNHLVDDGYLAIVVPDYTTNPFDLIIADHATHFSLETLTNLLWMGGFEVINISNTVINKEIVVICKKADRDVLPVRKLKNTKSNLMAVQKKLDWLVSVVASAQKIAEKNRPFGIFGTSIAANWIYGELAEVIDYFVDEDPDRVDRFYHQKPVYLPNTIPKGGHTFVCLQPNVVKNIVQRLMSNDYYLYATPEY